MANLGIRVLPSTTKTADTSQFLDAFTGESTFFSIAWCWRKVGLVYERSTNRQTSSLRSSRFEENSIKKIEGLQNCLNLQKSGPWKLPRDQAPLLFFFIFCILGLQVSVTVKATRNCMISARLNWFQMVPALHDLRILADIISSYFIITLRYVTWLPVDLFETGLKVTIQWQFPIFLRNISTYIHIYPQIILLWGRGIIFQIPPVPPLIQLWFLE